MNIWMNHKGAHTLIFVHVCKIILWILLINGKFFLYQTSFFIISQPLLALWGIPFCTDLAIQHAINRFAHTYWGFPKLIIPGPVPNFSKPAPVVPIEFPVSSCIDALTDEKKSSWHFAEDIFNYILVTFLLSFKYTELRFSGFIWQDLALCAQSMRGETWYMIGYFNGLASKQGTSHTLNQLFSASLGHNKIR